MEYKEGFLFIILVSQDTMGMSQKCLSLYITQPELQSSLAPFLLPHNISEIIIFLDKLK